MNVLKFFFAPRRGSAARRADVPRTTLRALYALLAWASCGGAAADTETVHTASGAEIVFDVPSDAHSEADMEYLRSLDREITRLFRAPPVRRGRLRIILSSETGEGGMSLRRARLGAELLLDRRLSSRLRSFDFRRRLAGMLLMARSGGDEPAGEMPAWVAAGLDGAIAAGQGAGRIARSVRRYPLLQALLQAGCRPDFRALTGIDFGKLSGAALEGARELCRFMAETAARYPDGRGSLLGSYAIGCLSRRCDAADEFDAVIGRRLSAASRGTPAARVWETEAGRAAFNGGAPRSGEFSLKLLWEITNFEYEDGGGEGESAARRKGSLPDLPRLLSERHPAAETLRRRLAQAVREFGGGLPGECLPFAERLAFAVEKLTGDSSRTEEETERLCGALKALENMLRRQAAVEKLLEETEKSRVPPYLLFRRELEEIAAIDGADGRRDAEAFLERVEKRYMGE